MPNKHAVVFAVLLALNAVLGTMALTRTLHLGQTSQKVAQKAASAVIATRTTQLDRFEASLRAQLAKRPPRLPKVPSTATSAVSAPSTAAAASVPQVRYVRPAPIIVHKHRPGAEYESGDGTGEAGGDD